MDSVPVIIDMGDGGGGWRSTIVNDRTSRGPLTILALVKGVITYIVILITQIRALIAPQGLAISKQRQIDRQTPKA